MANITSFLSEGFLKEFIETFPRDFFADEFLASVALYRFLERHTDVTLGGNKEEYSNLIQSDGLVRNLIDRYLQGDDSVKFQDWEKDTLPSNEKPFNFFFLTSSKSELSSKLSQRGLSNYQLTNTKTLNQITGYEAIPVTNNPSFSNRLNSWGDLKKKLLPFHSLVIVDNYLLTQPNNYTNPVIDSVIPLFTELLSFEKSQETKIYLTLVCFHQYKRGKRNNGESHNDWNSRETNRKSECIKLIIDLADNIKNYLDRHFIDSNIFEYSVVILDDSSAFHDRIIITNSQFLTSGNSFGHYNVPRF